MISLILVSHCRMITDGLKQMIDGMAANQENVTVVSVGGIGDGELGTDPIAIYDAIMEQSSSDKVLIFTDLGSAVLSSEMAIEMLDSDRQHDVYLVDAPLVEGAFITSVQITGTDSLPAILAEIEQM